MKTVSPKYFVGLLVVGILLGGVLFKNNFMLINDHVFTSSKDTMKEAELVVPANHAIPTVKLQVLKDSMKGFNIHVTTENFKFTPENVNQKDVVGEGHAHLYVDGVKITRLYGNWYYLGSVAEGTHKVSVSLNGNSHAQYMVKGAKIEDSVDIIVDTISGTPPAHQD